MITPPVTPVPITGHPDAGAASHTLVQGELRWTVIRSFLARGPRSAVSGFIRMLLQIKVIANPERAPAARARVTARCPAKAQG